ncbi:hypothetical protein PTTG_05116 [Puccinia triticina 1-1 BBBD Race 1]|uniref:Lipase_GDSL domain-containing protein n=2 Tax=Puccinia triticina TaxID=208348 RepID=A0A180GER1_PUCT1|nr:uncharacterized protein PtA15_5A806 [Puccinia triticina]OAV90423.1 hypothetical protein PTTG_05116 [Puccinia triticina 1-1 BBBD Race 1]WAQ85232.1 hypothetical protein PtA15_5A806 [Puccinia triticina]WAR58557.1 hypothetical protein PtB15_5B791 [Puccinia triticina]
MRKYILLGFLGAAVSASIVVAAIVGAKHAHHRSAAAASDNPSVAGRSLKSDVDSYATYAQRLSSNQWNRVQYSSVVIFGASDCDDAHPRSPIYADTLRGSAPYWHNRFTNGIVFGEYLAASTLTGSKINLLNYAYGDATVNNKLTNVNAPDTRTQMETYIDEVSSKKAKRGDEATGRVLHCVWIGINDIIQIWTDVIKNGTFQNGNIHGPQTGFEYATGRVHLEARELLDQVNLIHAHPRVNDIHSDFLLMLLPPLEILPNLYYQSKTLAKNDPALIDVYLSYIGNLTRLYNQELSDGIKALSQEANKASSSGHNLAYFDAPKYWYFVRSHPQTFNFLNVADACWNSTSGAVCNPADRWEYFDTLHPTTKMHEYIAQEITVQVNL